MTIIAMKNNIIACDGRYTDGGLIVYDDYLKMIEKKGRIFFFTGETCHVEMFTDCYVDPDCFTIPEIHKKAVISCVVFDGASVYCTWPEDERGNIIKDPIRLDAPFAIGSGRDHAYTAMDMGADAVSAVKFAIKRTSSCGGLIRAWSIKQGKENITLEPIDMTCQG